MHLIRATRPQSHFLVVQNSVIRDTRLSFRARGVLVYILSHSDGFRLTAEGIAAAGKEGRGAILTALRELREAGYLVVHKRRNERGHWRTETMVYDEPQTEVGFPDPGKTEVGFLDSGSLDSGSLDSGFLDAIEKNQQKNQQKNQEKNEKKTREREALPAAKPSPSAPSQLSLPARERNFVGGGWQRDVLPEEDGETREKIRENQTERGTRLPADYRLSESWLLEARKIRPELTAEQVATAAASFVSYWSSKPGKDGLKLNWFSSWLNWVRKERLWPAGGLSSGRADQPRILPPSSGASESESERERKIREFKAKHPGARLHNY